MTTKEAILEVQEKGYCVLREHLPKNVVEACKNAFWPVLLTYLEKHGHEPNRGPHRHFLPMPFDLPCFAPEFFFDNEILTIVRSVMDERVVADQWGCDVPLRGSEYQRFHVDYQRPLFAEAPDLSLPPYILMISFGLVPITSEHGPMEIAPGTHRMTREQAMRSVECNAGAFFSVPLEIGDVLIRHPWALHRGTPNVTDTPRALVTVRYVRRWYADTSREVNAIPKALWQSLTAEQREIMRFPVEN
ncbi:MAG TPA: phytanoyl-CoA dioxygenase family protein [Candidatus Angelobacter sp.]|nr:phytanoyl-CoA dioxygenase family protein [Candidatus Angelobacter sp.]